MNRVMLAGALFVVFATVGGFLVAAHFALPPRPVGQTVDTTGEVASVSKEAYAVRIVLIVKQASSTFDRGQSVEVTFTGIGDVSTWKAYELKPGDIIHLSIRYVENSYWEAVDSEWTYV